MNNICVIAPHADDETLGCGGVMLLSKKVNLIICADEPTKPVNKLKGLYGLNSLTEMKLSDGRFDTCNFGDIVSDLSKILKNINPDILFIPHMDIHTDHIVMHKASVSASKVFRSNIKEVYSYEVLSQTNISEYPFIPDTFVDIKNTISLKLSISEIYEDCLMKNVRSWREIEALAIYRGTQANVGYAEAFKTIRRMI